jgi:predicted AlkP superfamily phosphohydrolase/phosphomutase
VQRKLLVVCLAEATFDLIRPFADAGKMPNVARLMSHGVWGRLRSQMPMVTPQMCGTIVTGRSPGEHGLFDFYQRGPDGRFRETDGTWLKNPPVWQLLHERGLTCGIVNVPFTYPPAPIRGFMISGEDAPGAHASIAHPRGLYRELTARFGRYHLKDTFPGGRQKSDYLTLFTEDVRAQTDVFEHVFASRQWDFGMVFFSHTAMAQHYFWGDHLSRDASNPYRGVLESAYVALDTAIGRLVAAAGDNASVFVISDSGAGPIASGVNINRLLEERGFLCRRIGSAPSGGGGTSEGLRKRAQRYLQSERLAPLYFFVNHRLRPLKVWMQSRLSQSSIDWSRTRAYSRGQWGFVYVNLKGRDPHGIVERGAEYDELCTRIAREIEQLVDPASGERAVSRVWRGSELYHGPMVEWSPDLVIDWRDGAYMPNETSRSTAIFGPRQREYMSWPTTGSHRLDGVLIAAGPHVRSAGRIEGARLIDLLPTWMHLLGQKPPQDLQGSVLHQLFVEPERPRAAISRA